MLAESWRSRKSSSSSCSMGCCSSGGRGGVVMGLQVALGFCGAGFDRVVGNEKKTALPAP